MPDTVNVTTVDQLKPGDHISWKYNYAYNCHGIVEEVNGNSITIIHLEHPSENLTACFLGKPKVAKVVRKNVGLDALENLQKVIHSEEILSENPPEVVLERACTLVDLESTRNFHLRNCNCEHFARYCATNTDNVTSVDQLKPGDHISWKYNYAYNCHGIVEEVNGNSITIIHLDHPYLATSIVGKVKVVRKKVGLDEKENLQKVNHSKETLSENSPKLVLDRARRALNPRVTYDFNLCNFNCEHFARSCKTGTEESMQVRNGIDFSFTKLLPSVVNAFIKHGQVKAALGNKNILDVYIAALGGKKKLLDVYIAETQISSKGLICMAFIVEGGMFLYEAAEHCKKFQDGNLTSEEFVTCITRDLCKRVGGATGGLVGAYYGGNVGTLGGPLGVFIGATIGGVVGGLAAAKTGEMIGNAVGLVFVEMSHEIKAAIKSAHID